MEKSIDELRSKVRVLEDVENIKKLKAQYCAYCDDNFDADGVASLFVEKGIWNGGKNFGKYAGREAIRKFIAGVSKDVTFSAHMVVNPIIEVKGNKATGTWYLWMPTTFAKEGRKQAMWLLGLYNEEYTRTKASRNDRFGGWRFKSLKVKTFFLTPYEEGWHKKGSLR